MAFIVEPGESADYQLHLVRPDGAHRASYMSDDRSFIEMTVFNDKYNNTYENYYLKPGYFYQIIFGGVSQATFTKDPVEIINVGDKKDTSKMDNYLYKLTASQQATYEFSVQNREQFSNVHLFKGGYAEPMSANEDDSKSKSTALKTGQTCYVRSNMTDWLTASIAPDKDFVQVDSMLLQEGLVEPVGTIDRFTIDQSKGSAVARSTMKKPWFIIGMNKNSFDATPVLINSSGKVIKWTDESIAVGNMKVYGVKLGVEGAARTYKLTVTPASGNKDKAKVYSISINPKPAKPTGFKAKASTKSSTITLTWNKSTDVTGYKIYRSDSKTGKYYFLKTISSASTVKYNDKNLTKGKTYYYKLIPYAVQGGKTVNGTTSAVVSAKVLR